MLCVLTSKILPINVFSNLSKLYFGRSSCVTEDSSDTHPVSGNGSSLSYEDGPRGSSSVIFWPMKDGCLVSPPSQKLGALGSLTLAVWVKPNTTGEM